MIIIGFIANLIIFTPSFDYTERCNSPWDLYKTELPNSDILLDLV